MATGPKEAYAPLLEAMSKTREMLHQLMNKKSVGPDPVAIREELRQDIAAFTSQVDQLVSVSKDFKFPSEKISKKEMNRRARELLAEINLEELL